MATAIAELNNPELLKWARTTAGYSEEALAEKLNVSPDTLRAWETGAGAPTWRQLEAFAKQTRRPPAAFFLPTPPIEPPQPTDFRTLAGIEPGVFSVATRFAFRDLRNALNDTADLLDAIDSPASFSLPRWTMGNPVEPWAKAVRSTLGITVATQIKWGHDYAALNVWRSALFDHGVVVRVATFPMRDGRAFSMEAAGLGGITVNGADAPVARIFSLFHEVAHLCIGQPGVSGEWEEGSLNAPTRRIEQYCDSFAAAFLLPNEAPKVKDALASLRIQFTLDHAKEIGHSFKVSKYVVARAAVDRGYITDALYNAEVGRWRANDARPTLPDTEDETSSGGGGYYQKQLSRAGKRYFGLVFDALDQQAITTYDAGQYLRVQAAHLEEFRRRLIG